MEKLRLSVSDFIAITNQTLEYAYPSVEVEGEVAGFKVNQGKFVFFDLKDTTGTIGCFMMLFQLRMPIEDGMKVVVTAAPKLTAWGKFSLTVKAIRPSGEGSLKKSFELLKAKLEKEGLFDPERKRPLPEIPKHIAVISSTQAAGYADFMKIINDRWGGVTIDVAHTQVQGEPAARQIVNAITYFNERDVLPEVLVIIRGGGSTDDLAAFNDEPLVRAIAASRIPTLVGIGHETDESLADLVCDKRAVTPSNAAQIVVPDRREVRQQVRGLVRSVIPRVEHSLQLQRESVTALLEQALNETEQHVYDTDERLRHLQQIIQQVDPDKVLRRGYALLRGDQTVGGHIEIETAKAIIQARIEHYDEK